MQRRGRLQTSKHWRIGSGPARWVQPLQSCFHTDLLKGTLRAAEGEEALLLICPPTHTRTHTFLAASLWIPVINHVKRDWNFQAIVSPTSKNVGKCMLLTVYLQNYLTCQHKSSKVRCFLWAAGWKFPPQYMHCVFLWQCAACLAAWSSVLPGTSRCLVMLIGGVPWSLEAVAQVLGSDTGNVMSLKPLSCIGLWSVWRGTHKRNEKVRFKNHCVHFKGCKTIFR